MDQNFNPYQAPQSQEYLPQQASECWREGYFSTLRRVELTGEMVYPNHYFKYPQGIADENINLVDKPDPSIPIGYAAYPVGLTLLDYIEDSLN